MVIYCARERVPGDVVYGPVIREVFIIECNVSGYGSVIINGKEFSFGPRECYVLFPGDTVVHTSYGGDYRAGVYCAIDGLNLGRYFKQAGIDSENPFAPKKVFDEILGWVAPMMEDLGKKDAGAAMRQASRIYGILGILLREKTATASQSWVDIAIGLMETHYPDNLNVTGLAREVGLERSYFTTLFKEKTGLAPYQYLTTLRIQKACHLLENTDHPVAEISELVGLNPRNFARLFKKETGSTPLEYRHSYKNKQE